jgi:peptide deformylase
MKLKLAYYGDPILRKKALSISVINDEIRDLVRDMIETMEVENGIGIAAPQVHRSLALFITHVPLELPDNSYSPGEIRVFINPKVLKISQEASECSEGCLSIPNLHGNVIRPLKVTFEALNLEGQSFSEELIGLEARAFLHENDHINGVLYVDRMKGKARQEIEPKLREIKKNYSSSSKK